MYRFLGMSSSRCGARVGRRGVRPVRMRRARSAYVPIYSWMDRGRPGPVVVRYATTLAHRTRMRITLPKVSTMKWTSLCFTPCSTEALFYSNILLLISYSPSLPTLSAPCHHFDCSSQGRVDFRQLLRDSALLCYAARTPAESDFDCDKLHWLQFVGDSGG